MPFDAAGLNPEQKRAVETVEGPLLIIAGAGSGKTRVITMRIARMLELGIPQRAILALTFTNKAAREMSERIQDIAGRKLRDLTISTFHSFGVSVLKRHAGLLGYRDNFSIYDVQDQMSLLRESAREIKMEIEHGEAMSILQQFSAAKTGRMPWSDLPTAYRELYEDYAEHLKLYNAVDFDDLILLPARILEEHPEVAADYHERYRYIMVDEFQDTSRDQYALLSLLGRANGNVAVVGDDDQSIYSWRGANYENFQLFEHDFPGYAEIKLERNYRSTDTILAAANGVIANNQNRKTKMLWTGTKEGRPIQLTFPDDEASEGIFIAETIKTLAMREDLRYGDVGVLVRTNSLTRNLEIAFLSENIPYRVSGGQSFFQRKEIKDITSYIRLLANPDDDVSLLRVINTPRRGIGRKTIQTLVETAEQQGTSLFGAIAGHAHASDSSLGKRAVADLAAFFELVEEFRPRIFQKRKMAEALRELVERVDYWAHLVGEHPTNEKAAKWKHRNISLFIEFVERYERDPDNLSPSPFEFLSRITLDPRDDLDDPNDAGKVNLMTIHAAKGLEHEVVFVAGCESGIIPHARALEEDPSNIEEERRLFYVALTRAKRKLYITSCRSRKILREQAECSPSPFLEEIPEELIEYVDAPESISEDEGLDYFAALKAKLGGQ